MKEVIILHSGTYSCV